MTGCFWDSDPTFVHPPTDKNIRAVPHIETEESVLFDVAYEADGTLHLLWQTQSQGVFYQQGSGGGSSWTQPLELAPPAEGPADPRFENRPRLLLRGDRLVALWHESSASSAYLCRRESSGRGESWSSEVARPVTTLPGDGASGAPAPEYAVLQLSSSGRAVRYTLAASGLRPSSQDAGDLRAGDAAAEEQVREDQAGDESYVYLVRAGLEGIAFFWSDDLGSTWSEPTPFFSSERFDRVALSSTGVALTKHSGRLHVALSKKRIGASKSDWNADLFAMHVQTSNGAPQGGWSTPALITPSSEALGISFSPNSFEGLKLLTLDSKLVFFFNTNSTIYALTLGEDGRPEISNPVPINGPNTAAPDLAVLPVQKEGEDAPMLRLAWADRRFQKMDFFGPVWRNNDLLLATLSLSAIERGNRTSAATQSVGPDTARVVTPQLSYVRSPLLVQAKDNATLAFWAGRRKVGKTLDAYGAPSQVFFARVFEDDVP